MTIGESLKESRSPAEEPRKREARPAEILLFVMAALVVSLVLASGRIPLDPADRDLIDTDGYMRYLRVEELADTGDWYDSESERSNYPLGESQHWTRVLDVYVLALSWLLSPFLGGEALYWAAFVNAPLILIAIGLALHRWFAPRLPESVASLMMPLLLGLPLVVGYASPGRVDHHAAILLVLVVTAGAIVSGLESADRRTALTLAGCLTVGLWLSTEFLVPVGLTALTIAVSAATRMQARLAGWGGIIFAGAALGIGGVLVLERGSGLGVIEYDKISIVHLAVIISIAGVFAAFRRVMGEDVHKNWWKLVALGAAATILLLAIFPSLAAGPFVDVDSTVKEIWLYRVGELRPIWADRSWVSLFLLIGPMAVGLAAAAWSLVAHAGRPRWVVPIAAWLSVYAVLTAFQVRWAIFGHILAIPLALEAFHPWYERLEARPLAVIVRPVLIVSLIFGGYAIATGLDRLSPEEATTTRCELEGVLPTIQAISATTVLAEQDVGPEILYRTNHRVIATPYHRNESGILYVRDVMSTPASDVNRLRETLAARDVGLILVCPHRIDITRPEDPSGTFYESLLGESPPPFVTRLPAGAGTDHLLFRVQT